jgi:hypothetical protein
MGKAVPDSSETPKPTGTGHPDRDHREGQLRLRLQGHAGQGRVANQRLKQLTKDCNRRRRQSRPAEGGRAEGDPPGNGDFAALQPSKHYPLSWLLPEG